MGGAGGAWSGGLTIVDPDAKRGISTNFLFVTKEKLQIIWISPNLDQSHSNNPDTKSCDFG